MKFFLIITLLASEGLAFGSYSPRTARYQRSAYGESGPRRNTSRQQMLAYCRTNPGKCVSTSSLKRNTQVERSRTQHSEGSSRRDLNDRPVSKNQEPDGLLTYCQVFPRTCLKNAAIITGATIFVVAGIMAVKNAGSGSGSYDNDSIPQQGVSEKDGSNPVNMAKVSKVDDKVSKVEGDDSLPQSLVKGGENLAQNSVPGNKSGSGWNLRMPSFGFGGFGFGGLGFGGFPNWFGGKKGNSGHKDVDGIAKEDQHPVELGNPVKLIAQTEPKSNPEKSSGGSYWPSLPSFGWPFGGGTGNSEKSSGWGWKWPSFGGGDSVPKLSSEAKAALENANKGSVVTIEQIWQWRRTQNGADPFETEYSSLKSHRKEITKILDSIDNSFGLKF